MLYSHVRKYFVVIIFGTPVKFGHTEGPFIHSPTLWDHLEFHLTPPPCTFSPPVQTKQRLSSCDQAASGPFSAVCSSPSCAEDKQQHVLKHQTLTASVHISVVGTTLSYWRISVNNSLCCHWKFCFVTVFMSFLINRANLDLLDCRGKQ